MTDIVIFMMGVSLGANSMLAIFMICDAISRKRYPNSPSTTSTGKTDLR